MNSKRVIATALALVVAVAGVWAAGQGEGAATSGPVELVHYIFNAGDVSESGDVFAAINEIIEPKIGATVEYVDIPGGEFEQRIQVVINSGEDYDVTFTSSWRNNYYENIARGAFTDLTDLLPEYAPVIWSEQQEYIDAARVNGRIYAVLNEQIFARSRMTGLPYELADEAGVDPDEYSARSLGGENIYELDLEMREKIAAIAPEDAVFTSLGAAVAWDYNLIFPVVNANVPGAVRGEGDDLTVINQFDTPEFREILDYNRMLLDRGLIRNLDLIDDPENFRRLKADGLVVQPIQSGGTFKPGGEEQLAERWQYLYYERQMTEATLTTGGIIATMMAVSSISENPTKAVEYLDTLMDEDVYMLLHYGIEGEHYNVTSDGFMQVIQGSGYNRGVPWSAGNQFDQIPVVGQPKTVWQETRELNASAKKSPILGFAFDPTNVQAEIGQCRSVHEEYMESLLDGVRPIDDYEEMLDKFEAAGASRLIAELQRQIDAWAETR